MTKVALFKQDGAKAGEVELNDAVFAIVPNEAVVTDAVLMQRASMRQGTHSVKNRSAVSGGGRKPWRQKGTGNARQGSIRAPQWRGGGISMGPTPRSYSYKINRKAYRLALKSALSDKVAQQNFIVVDKFDFDKPSTKLFAENLSKLNSTKKTLLVIDAADENVKLSARNLPNVQVVTAQGVNVYDLVRAQKVVIAESAAKQVEEGLS
ncbi:50S ribosomal protein L4 [Oenococcus kitaharae]|uniref:Large ribosomal subunit protein uL4 n=1 Tax=Oenococcus kitaharae DSM 17330 TaxID=1045004 RepID=G9WFH8_9LACO|nr:50S ribosomal protein L4 [Oenococcus kitaharae]EHN59135.1 LSU ribosomal protein L4p (L1e) [Oenococcus kitaharae DSM 17330]OEY81987.1 50S ribosomal protein L4 [Oenococcus kitaharae]OEY82358.1 50S ribosomal protein L4 [Oenococcus kitaharae]OEY82764.1 50S ribosomal protein L4 [Oenococcus kitaharae]